MTRWQTSILALIGLGIGGCQTNPTIHHVVLIELEDSNLTTQLVADCDELLAPIPSVRQYWCGVHGDFGRAQVDDQYDVALCVSFDDPAGYQIYLDHPDHVELVTRWKPKMEWIRIHDVVPEGSDLH